MCLMSQSSEERPVFLPAENELASLPAVALFGQGSRTRMMALCAEPGMGRTDVITEIVASSLERGYAVERRGLLGWDPESAASYMVRLARKVSRQKGSVVVALDEIPASDESSVRREARALRRLWEAQIPVVFSIVPEAAQLLEELPECAVLGPSDLLIARVTGLSRGDVAFPLKSLTRGIPSLVRSLSGADLAKEPEANAAYKAALGTLIRLSLRASLPDEELRLRLAMLLLGKGDLRELSMVLGRVSSELMASLREQAPLFGVGEQLDSFQCILGTQCVVLDVARSSLRAACALFGDVALAVLKVLTKREEFSRAAIVSAFCAANDAHHIVREAAVGFMDVGEGKLVRQALDGATGDAEGDEASLQRFGLCRQAMMALCDQTMPDEILSMDTNGLLATRFEDRDALMLIDARRALRGSPLESEFPENDWTLRGRRLLVHREAFDLMSSGRFSSALRLLLANPVPEGEITVSCALLRVDAELARLMLCDVSAQDGRDLSLSEELLNSSAARGLSGYAALLSMARALMSGDKRASSEVDELIACAERKGDVLIQAIALVAGCVLDLRRGAGARAHVRSILAVTLARRAGSDYVARVGVVLGEVGRFLMGEKLPVETVEERPHDDLGYVEALVRETMQSEEDDFKVELEDGGRVPREAFWLLALLGEGMGDFSRLLDREMPPAWHKALLSMGTEWSNPERGLEPDDVVEELGHREAMMRPKRGDGAAGARLCLLGRFSVSVNGVCVNEAELGHRNAIPLLVYLALQQGAAVRRYQIVEQVWPELDYAMGFNKIYQATCFLKAKLDALGVEKPLFVSSRASKTMALNVNAVSCDVDEFRACACAAVDGIDDVQTMEMARRVERLYKGDLYVPTIDATGFITAMKSQLRVLYADAMAAGADAALRLGKRRTAARLAGNAMLADDRREDAMVTLVQALRASGRNAEAEQHYRRYARRLAKSAQGSQIRLLGQVAAESDPGPSVEVREEGRMVV